MGYYISTDTSAFKEAILISKYGAVSISQPQTFSEVPADKALICIVHNSMFEAAGLCYSAEEFARFTDPNDHRYKTWVLMDKAQANQLAGYKDIKN
jgi:hypothetical protein